MSDFVQQQNSICDFATADSWVILSPIEQSIKQKIEAVGTPLKDWDINIYRGVLTGCNEAFIIDSAKRNEILANCQSDEEREKTAELIRPILRGRDIKRYGYEWGKLWLINTHNGIKGKLERIHIEDYPAIKEWLDNGGIAYNGKLYRGFPQIEKRADQGETPYNLRNCAYLEDFSKPKIIYPDICTVLSFKLDSSCYYLSNTAYFLTTEKEEHLKYILRVLNSSVMDWYYRTLSVQLGEKAVRMFSIYVLNIPIPPISDKPIEDMLKLSKEERLFISGS